MGTSELPQKAELAAICDKSFWKHITVNSLVRLGDRKDFLSRKKLSNEVLTRVANGAFTPGNVGYLSVEKANGVPRFVPVLDRDTVLVYFACVSEIDSDCAELSVDGTYGAWTLGGERRRKEESRFAAAIAAESSTKVNQGRVAVSNGTKAELSVDDSDILSGPASPYNKHAWLREWQNYWKAVALLHGQSGKPNGYFISFDIANFYDSIDVALLLNELRSAVPGKTLALNLLHKILRGWRADANYAERGVGIPMDLVGDMSRVLANFFLVEFDRKFSEYAGHQGLSYLRWADDMLVYVPDERKAGDVVYEAGRLLHARGLNLNAAKIRRTKSEEMPFEWCFKIMDLLEEDETVEKGCLLLERTWGEDRSRRTTALKRAVSRVAQMPEITSVRPWLVSTCFDQEIWKQMSHAQLRALLSLVTEFERKEKICSCVIESRYTQAHLSLIRCLEGVRNQPWGLKLFQDVTARLVSHPDALVRSVATRSVLG